MTILMQLEARVITNLGCPASALEPRLHASSKDPRDQVRVRARVRVRVRARDRVRIRARVTVRARVRVRVG